MAFFLLLIYIALIFLRPQEWVPFMYGMRAVNYVAIPTIGATVFSMTQEETKLIKAPQSWLMLALFGAMLMSHAAHTYFAAFMETLTGDFLRVVILYFLITVLVTSVARLKAVVLVMVIGVLFMSWHGILQWHHGEGFGGYEPMIVHGTVRVLWLGFFNDPNDLALILVTVLPFLFSKVIAKRSMLPSRLLSALACVPIIYTVFITNSRGGWLAFGAMCCMFVIMHMKKKKLALIVAGLAFWALIGVGPDRLGISDDASSRQRVALWGAGNHMLKQWPLFGAGLGRFTEYSQYSQVAHNSFIQTWAELGMVGYFVWLSLMLATIKDSYALEQLERKDPDDEEGVAPPKGPKEPTALDMPPAPQESDAIDPEDKAELSRIGRAIIPAITGFMAASFFLSRSYIIPLYILCALGASSRAIYEDHAGPLPGAFVPKDLKMFAIITLVSVPGMWLTIRGLN